ncbi:hypothetical protein GYMLUDRAFT_48266 [Collybiopsis luxurians FD-317 M1]|uniref:F-box domain-containing protein n=1 Tax=Collybiopsis luxurians FD-317 M1 TaxID=944289 RepID=A0A0D0AWX9_9AGAR|nr:hypothetical protein GYMLUDRAFT_48266 [Collybiopsis luxurians FD-317 M1]
MNSLPVEIIDYILAYLADVPQKTSNVSLANLALVSPVLLQRSRGFFFHSVSINPDNIEKLSDLLGSPNQTVSKHVRTVRVDGKWTSGESLQQSIAIAIGNKVDSLSMHNFAFQSLPSDFLSEFSTLTTLELANTTFISVSQMMGILSGFRNLQSASLFDIIWNDPSSDTLDTTYPFDVPSSLTKLSLERCYKRDVMGCLLSLHPPPLIRDLNLGLVSPSDAEAIGKYIAHLGPSLSSLSLGFSSLDAGGDAEDFYNHCPLSLNTGLESIHFDRLVYMGEYRLTISYPWIAKILSTLCSPLLTCVCFSIYLPAIDPLSCLFDLYWSELDQVLAQRQGVADLSRFECVRFWLYFDEELGHGVLDSVIEKIQGHLPLCSQRGILRFVTRVIENLGKE